MFRHPSSACSCVYYCCWCIQTYGDTARYCCVVSITMLNTNKHYTFLFSSEIPYKKIFATFFATYMRGLLKPLIDPRSFNFILQIIILSPKTFQISMFCIWGIFFGKYQRFSLKYSYFVNFGTRKISFLNRSEFRQKLIRTITRVLMQHPRPYCGLG